MDCKDQTANANQMPQRVGSLGVNSKGFMLTHLFARSGTGKNNETEALSVVVLYFGVTSTTTALCCALCASV